MPLLLMLAGMLAQAQDPLAPARAGKLQCTMPNVAAKTCMALSRYVPLAGKQYREETRIVAGVDPLITMESVLLFEMEGDAACSIVRREDITGSKFLGGRQPLPAREAQAMIDRMMTDWAPLIGKKMCVVRRSDGQTMVQEFVIDGVVDPESKLPFIWVGPDEGYTLGVNFPAG